jgi:hypothetical protein
MKNTYLKPQWWSICTTYFKINKTWIFSSQHLRVCVILRRNWDYNLHTSNRFHLTKTPRVFYNVGNETLHITYVPSLQRVSLVPPKCYQRSHYYRWKFWTPVPLIVWLLLMYYFCMVWDIFGCEPHVCDANPATHWRCAKHLLRCHVACFGLNIFIKIAKR